LPKQACHRSSAIDYFSSPLSAPEGHDWLVCEDVRTGVKSYRIVPKAAEPKVPTARDLVEAARARLTVPVPGIRTAPPRGGRMLVGVRTWFWIDQEEPEPVTASIPGLSATLTARPIDTTVAFADGTRLRCAGGGVPWDPGRSASEQRSDCTRVFQVAGDERVEATVRWSLSWTASNGQRGTLPPLARTSAVVLHLQAAEATTD
jgi:hypothetical protein